MPARVSEQEVKELFNPQPLISVVSFINDAHLLVEETLVGKGLSEERLTVIEKYLAGHFVALSEEKGALIKKKMGDSEESYAGLLNYGQGLTATRYGQQVLVMDTTGSFAAIAKGKPRGLFKVV